MILNYSKKGFKEITTEIKNTLEGMNTRLDDTEECIGDLEDRKMEITQSEQQKEKQILKNEDNLRDHWDNIKLNNIHSTVVPEGEERGKCRKYVDKIMAENFPNLKKEINIHVQAAQRVLNKINIKQPHQDI